MKMTANRWGVVMLILAIFIFLVFPICSHAQVITSRKFWVMPLDTLAVGHLKHTHVQTTGKIVYCVWEEDGDRHIRLISLNGTGRFIIVEWIPELTLLKCPPVGSVITVWGITRMDPEHLWAEIHPVEGWKLTQ